MNWGDVGKLVGGVAPILGTALGGPVGGVVGSLIGAALGCESTPESVSAAVAADPAALVKIREIEARHAEEMQRLAIEAQRDNLAAETSQIQAVAETIQTEAKSNFWLEANWHAIGSLAALAWLIGVYFVLPVFHVAVPSIPETAFIMVAAILGVAQWKLPSVISAKR